MWYLVWLNGGPGCSSLAGLATGNGPISFVGNTTKIQKNPYSWTKLGHVLYIDQPVGTGYSTASTPYPVRNMDRITSDFHNWLRIFFSRLPHLQSKRVHLIGESFAGYYIPYFASAIVHNQDSLPLNLHSLSLGDPTLGNPATTSSITIGSFLRSHRSTLDIPAEIVSAFSEADEACGHNALVQQAQIFPPRKNDPIRVPVNPDDLDNGVSGAISGACYSHPTTADDVLSSILNSTCEGSCATLTTAVDYVRTQAAARAGGRDCFDIYDIANGCDAISMFPLLETYFSRADVQAALNIPPSSSSPSTSTTPSAATGTTASTTRATPFSVCNEEILKILPASGPFHTPPSYSILPEMATIHRIPIHVFSGANDMLLNHVGTELVLQNMTWNGARGFSRKPDRAFYVDNAAPTNDEGGLQAGTWGEERGVSYHLFYGAGHSVFAKKPREMFAFVRDVVVGRS